MTDDLHVEAAHLWELIRAMPRAAGVAEIEVVLKRARVATARFTVQPPAWQQDGIPPAETTHACLYTHVRPCKEDHPTDTDQWCGYCRGTCAGLVTL